MLKKPIPLKYIPKTIAELDARIEELQEVLFQRHVSKKYDENYRLYAELLKAYRIFRENDQLTNIVVRELFFDG